MSKFIKRFGLLNTTFDYSEGIKICATTEICHIKRKNKSNVKPRSGMGRSLVLRRSTKRHK